MLLLNLDFVRAGTPDGRVFFIDSMHGWVVYFNLIIRTTDGGTTWARGEIP